MDAYGAIAWLPLCAGASIAGLALAFLAFRRRGAASGMRVTAWALLPMAAYLTGALQALWTIGTTVAGFVTSLVFNPSVWAGVAVAGLSAVLFVASGVMRGRRLAFGRKKKAAAPQQPATPGVQQGDKQGGRQTSGKPAAATPGPQPAVSAKKPAKADDDFSDIEDLLKRRGIS
ncbi:hypothetical protein SAMN05444920_117239 [Nonomuraea solani]|uniref:Cellulose synthase n=1 Tax=Nonomuraea solani TaxID=1144553 RepID=A0A1H6ESH5_9ACTN|nr:cellulose synthase [Nonomuraea solani]SEH00808.1 hypothetical protein SAMN05444920_117239 [Nonomuraea solani]